MLSQQIRKLFGMINDREYLVGWMLLITHRKEDPLWIKEGGAFLGSV